MPQVFCKPRPKRSPGVNEVCPIYRRPGFLRRRHHHLGVQRASVKHKNSPRHERLTGMRSGGLGMRCRMYTQINTVFLAVYCLTSLSAADKSARSDLVAATAELRSMKASVEEQVGRIKAVRDSDAGGSSYSTARTAYERTATNFNTVMEAIAVIGQHPGKESRRLA